MWESRATRGIVLRATLRCRDKGRHLAARHRRSAGVPGAARTTYGHVSDGMIASARELGLGEHDGVPAPGRARSRSRSERTPALHRFDRLGCREMKRHPGVAMPSTPSEASRGRYAQCHRRHLPRPGWSLVE
jgi:hypothetical protein